MNLFELKHLRAGAITISFLLASVGMLAVSVPPAALDPALPVAYITQVASLLRQSAVEADAPSRSETPSDPAPSQAAGQAQAPAAVAAPALPAIDAYYGLGAWIDLFDFETEADAHAIVNELAARGVKTLYLQTARWNTGGGIEKGAAVNVFIERSHAAGIKVIGWYLPGFNDIETDIRKSLAVLEHRTPQGHRFDGFAPDIEDKRAVGNDTGRFNRGIIEYSVRLRQSVPPGTALGAIVVDAKNNKRAPGYWAGFPWPEIGQNYDVVLPMAYWSVVKKKGECYTTTDVAAYQREVVAETNALMGTTKPIHVIGGIADCASSEEIAAFVDVSVSLGVVGGSIYDFWTTHGHPHRDAMWSHLGKFNQLLPAKVSNLS